MPRAQVPPVNRRGVKCGSRNKEVGRYSETRQNIVRILELRTKYPKVVSSECGIYVSCESM